MENLNNTNNANQTSQTQKANDYLNKLKTLLSGFILKIKPIFENFDSKFKTFMPNDKLRKVIYIAMASLFSIMFLIIVLGVLFSPIRNSNTEQSLFKKPVIVQESPKAEVVLSENQKQINEFKKEIDNLNFPDNRINIPLVELNLTIDQSR